MNRFPTSIRFCICSTSTTHLLLEDVDARLSVGSLAGDGGDVGPVEQVDDVHHGDGLQWPRLVIVCADKIAGRWKSSASETHLVELSKFYTVRCTLTFTIFGEGTYKDTIIKSSFNSPLVKVL